MTTAWRALERHWFAPASLDDLAIVRIVLVGAQLFVFLPSLDRQLWLLGTDPSLYVPIPTLKVMLLPFGGWGIRPDAAVLTALWYLGVLTGIAALLGTFTRLSLLGFAATNTLLIAHAYSYGQRHHPEAVMVMALWVLALAPVGARWSWDEIRSRVRASVRTGQFAPPLGTDAMSELARWPLRVIQWLLVLVYFSAGLSKLVSAGPDWLNGHTLTYYLVQDGLNKGVPLGLWLAEHPMAVRGLSVVALAFELSFAFAILVPRLTWGYVALGAVLHLGIWFTMQANFFQYIFVYVAFVETLRTRTPVRLATPASQRHWTVVYDGLCGLCVRSMVILDYLDLKRRLRSVDFERNWGTAAALIPDLTMERARHAMLVVTPDGRVHSGFFAFRAVARAVPLLWPVLPLFYAPLANRIGPWAYGQIASRRSRHVCSTSTCCR